MEQASQTSYQIPGLAVLSALVVFAALQTLAYVIAGGVFEYPLDDVYIHLAMAEQIGVGGYGVNAGEYSSAASSPLYPLLLLPFAGEEAQRFVPFVVNVAGLILMAWLWGLILVQAGYDQGRKRFYGVVLACLGPLALNMAGLAFVGMEHALHAAASLAIVYGLLRMIDEGRVDWFLIAGVFFAPLFRLEGLALSLVATGLIFAAGHYRSALIALFLAVVPIICFSIFLMTLGLSPLPNSVLTKLGGNSLGHLDWTTRFFRTIAKNMATAPGRLLAFEVIVAFGLILIPGLLKNPLHRAFALAIALAGLAHLCFGQVGWLHRYEPYVLITLMGGLLALVPRASSMLTVVPVALALMISAMFYVPKLLTDLAPNPRAIHAQQQQMSRFTKDYWQAPVAVNDLGWVAWRNPNYVLDLWGLASDEARELRLSENIAPGWAGALTDRHDVELAMVYESWLENAVGEDWIKLGILHAFVGFATVGGYDITFYATTPDAAERLVPLLKSFSETLPAPIHFEFEPDVG